ncbi:glycosyltransferase family 2 protein, partial [Gottfriedia acidiceleris]
INILYSFTFLFLMIIYGSFFSVSAVLLEEWRLVKYKKVSELNRLFFYSLTEAIWYRPMLTYWRVVATISIFLGQKRVGEK